MSQQGLARLLGETRTHHILAPGLISIEPLSGAKNGYSGEWNIAFPPKIGDKSLPQQLNWLFPEQLKGKVLSTNFISSIEPFYPSFVHKTIAEEDYNNYIHDFVNNLSEHYKEVFYLPLSFTDNPNIDTVLETDCSFIVLVGFRSILHNQNRFTATIVNLKEKLSPDVALYLPGPIPPSYYSFLVYAGIDFFDTSIAYYLTKNGYFLTESNVYPMNNHPKCYCPHCRTSPPDLLSHNLMILKNTLASVRYSLQQNILRERVEQDIHNSVSLAAALKHFDSKYLVQFQNRFPLRVNAPVKCVGEESLYHPAIVEYRRRIKERFIPNINSPIVLLIPCSAKKPYSFSQSHKLFRQAVKAGIKNTNLINELIITSPLGVVPRELESIYPARFYDIPVSGKWSIDEIKISSELLLSILSNYPKNTIVINHTHGKGYENIVEHLKEHTNFEVIDTALQSSTTSKEALNELTNRLRDISENTKEKSINPPSLFLRTLQAIADFQFGKGSGKVLFNSKVKIKGRYPRNRELFMNNKHLGTLTTVDGFLSLSPSFAQLIVDKSKVNVEFTAEKVTGSSIYAPGCAQADESILPNDEIFLVYNGIVIGTATAFVSGKDMNKMKSGMIAKIKKKRKNNEN